MTEPTHVAPPQRDLVFTSAGDHHAVARWMRGAGDRFDLCVVYYGDGAEAERLAGLATHFFARKGAKFQNLHWLIGAHPELLRGYRAVFVADDDLVLGGAAIAALFRTLRRYDLWALQPAFLPEGRISHPITAARHDTILRRVNFIEVGAMLARTDVLLGFMDRYDPRLTGWGVDLWFCQELDAREPGRMAVVDRWPCVNPHHELAKSGAREIERLGPDEVHRDMWLEVAAERGLRNDLVQREYGGVPGTVRDRVLQRAAHARSRIRHRVNHRRMRPA